MRVVIDETEALSIMPASTSPLTSAYPILHLIGSAHDHDSSKCAPERI